MFFTQDGLYIGIDFSIEMRIERRVAPSKYVDVLFNTQIKLPSPGACEGRGAGGEGAGSGTYLVVCLSWV